MENNNKLMNSVNTFLVKSISLFSNLGRIKSKKFKNGCSIFTF